MDNLSGTTQDGTQLSSGIITTAVAKSQTYKFKRPRIYGEGKLIPKDVRRRQLATEASSKLDIAFRDGDSLVSLLDHVR